jgi:predicted RNase H-like HicB family nuclease
MAPMPHYIALIHKETDSCYGVSFPDLPGVVTAGDSIDEAMQKANEVIEFAAEDWSQLTGQEWPRPRSIDALRSDPAFRESAADAVVAAVPFRINAEAVE